MEEDKLNKEERKKVFTLSEHHCQYLLLTKKFGAPISALDLVALIAIFDDDKVQFCNLETELSTLMVK